MKIYLNGEWQDLPFKVTASAFSGASSTVDGAKGLVPTPKAGEQEKFLGADGTWKTVNLKEFESLTVTGDVTIGGNVTTAGNLKTTGTITASKVYNAVYNDYAEWFERGDDAKEGHIIALDETSDKEQYVKATNKSKAIVGICTNNYAQIIGGEPHEDYIKHNLKKYIPVSLAGRVPVWVKGKVQIGDEISPSEIPGVGMVGRTAPVGMALESSNSEEIKLIKVLVRR